MKIAIFGPVYPYRGGIAHFTARLAQAFDSSGHQVKLISFRGDYPKMIYKGKETRDHSQSPLAYPAEFSIDYRNPFTWRAASQQIIDFQPDTVMITWWTPYWAFCYAAIVQKLAKSGINIGFLVHNLLPHESHWYDLPFTRLALRQADWIVTLNPREKDRTALVFPDKNIFVLPHPVYDNFRQNNISRLEARERLGLPADRFIALFFGIIRPYKGLKYLLEATKICVDNKLPILTLVAGEFWEGFDEARSYIHEAGIQDYVRLDDHYIPNEEVELYFSAADVLVAPYTGGTQSGVLKIGMAFGLPIVATERIAGEWETNNYPYLSIVRPNEPADISTCLDNLYLKNEKANGLELTSFSWNDWVDTFSINFGS